MKATKLSKIKNVFGGLFIISLIWLMIELFSESFNPIAAYVCMVMFIITAYTGYKHAEMASKDPEGFINDTTSELQKKYPEYWKKYGHYYKSKWMIILTLVGLSVNCNGQTTFEKDFQEADSLISMKDNVIRDIINPVNINNGIELPYTLRIYNLDLVDDLNITVNMLLEYKKECFNDSTYVEYYKALKSPSEVYDSKTGITTTLAVYIVPSLIKEWQHKTPSFPDFLEWIEKRKTK
jgi:hypothetical protein